MRVLQKILTALLLQYLLFLLFTATSMAHILSLNLSSDNRHLIPLTEFEFSNVGYVSFNISSSARVTSTSSRPPDEWRIGFLVEHRELRDEQPFRFQNYSAICAWDFKLDSEGRYLWFPQEEEQVVVNRSAVGFDRLVEELQAPKKRMIQKKRQELLRPLSLLFTLQNLSHSNPSSSSNFTKLLSFPVTNPGMKSLFLVNCNNESSLTMEVRADLYNMDHDNTTKNYLSSGLTHIPFLYHPILSFIYLIFLGVWIRVCVKNRGSFNWAHLLMGGLLAINFLYPVCVAADLNRVKVTGVTTGNGLDELCYVIQLIRAVVLFTVMVLISTGCFFWKPSLEKREKLVLMIVIVLQVWGHVDPVLSWEAAVPYNKLSYPWQDLICCVLIFLPLIRWSLTGLMEIADNDLKSQMNCLKLLAFMVMFFFYVLITRMYSVGVYQRWANCVMMETGLVVFCMAMFCTFRPIETRKMIVAKADTELSWLSTSKQRCIDALHSLV